MDRKKKNVLITGGSRGIGAEAVKLFTAHGSSVAFFYKNSYEKAIQLSKETGALNIRCDVSNLKSVAEAMKVVNAFFNEKIDTLICNAGSCDFGLLQDIGAERWKKIIDTDLNGVYYTVNEVIPSMISRKKGCIIIVSSMWGQVGASCEVAYSTAKAGLIGFTKALAKELGPSGIRVNCIAPGMIDTDMNMNLSEQDIESIADETPLERIGTTKDIAETMHFLSSDAASFITGQVIGVNGGLVM